MDDEPRPRRFSVDEYHMLSAVGILRPEERVELIDGSIVLMDPIRDAHALRHASITRALSDPRFGGRFLIFGQASFPVGRDSEPQPDLALAPDSGWTAGGTMPRIDELIATIEISDETFARDTTVKLRLYARGRVPNYLVVDLEHDVLVVHRKPHDLGYAVVETLRAGDSFALDGVDRLTIEASSFLNH